MSLSSLDERIKGLLEDRHGCPLSNEDFKKLKDKKKLLEFLEDKWRKSKRVVFIYALYPSTFQILSPVGLTSIVQEEKIEDHLYFTGKWRIYKR